MHFLPLTQNNLTPRNPPTGTPAKTQDDIRTRVSVSPPSVIGGLGGYRLKKTWRYLPHTTENDTATEGMKIPTYWHGESWVCRFQVRAVCFCVRNGGNKIYSLKFQKKKQTKKKMEGKTHQLIETVIQRRRRRTGQRGNRWKPDSSNGPLWLWLWGHVNVLT